MAEFIFRAIARLLDAARCVMLDTPSQVQSSAIAIWDIESPASRWFPKLMQSRSTRWRAWKVGASATLLLLAGASAAVAQETQADAVNAGNAAGGASIQTADTAEPPIVVSISPTEPPLPRAPLPAPTSDRTYAPSAESARLPAGVPTDKSIPAVGAKEVPNAFAQRVEQRRRADDVVPPACDTGCEYTLSDTMQGCNGEASGVPPPANSAARPAPGCRRAAYERYRACMATCGAEVPPLPRVSDPRAIAAPRVEGAP